jgi:hypothetical protein
MAQIDTHRAAYNRVNGNIQCGKRENPLTPTVTKEERSFYSVQLPNKTKIVNTIAEVNALLRVYSTAKVVKTTKIITTETRHKRIK